MLRNRMFPLYCSRALLAAPLLAAPASAPEPGYSEQALEMSRLVRETCVFPPPESLQLSYYGGLCGGLL
jgi:hypothetical protein